jgi:hypothetical protein
LREPELLSGIAITPDDDGRNLPGEEITKSKDYKAKALSHVSGNQRRC